MLGTQDMIVSRLLMRGYGEWRSMWPVTFGLLHCSSQFVFDETQLLGPALATSLQLHGLREALGSAGGCATMWMSATVSAADLVTPDYRGPDRTVELAPEDLADEKLAQRLEAARVIRHAAVPADAGQYPAALAEALLAWHVPGTATIAITNTVERALAVYDALQAAAPAAELLLLHSRFRPPERSITAARLDTPMSAAGRIVVSTQVLEAGVDTSCQTMFTELAPWTSMVQRAGRCNRAGGEPGAALWWAPPPLGRSASAPYDDASLAAAEAALARLEQVAVTPRLLQNTRVAQATGTHAVLRRRDLLQLFDTAPDLSGADIDVTPWVRDGDDLTAAVAWRPWPDGRPAADDEPAPERDELCPAPLAGLRRSAGRYWVYDQVDGRWRRCVPGDIRPGAVLLADAAAGGYLPARGWSPESTKPVPATGRSGSRAVDAIGRDPATFTGHWVTLRNHLAETEDQLRGLARGCRRAGLAPEQLEAAALAARYHDLGKAFPYFQDFLRDSTPGGPPEGGPWAKSPGHGGRHTARPYLRHELVTALALLHPACPLLAEAPEADLVAYLAAAHHGKVRLSVRSLPGEAGCDPPRMMGVQTGDELPPVELPDGARLPSLRLDTGVFGIGEDAAGRMSWTARVVALRDRPDLGPFRLAYLEALVRVADWLASGRARMSAPPGGAPPGPVGGRT